MARSFGFNQANIDRIVRYVMGEDMPRKNPHQTQPRDRHIVIKQNGSQKRYRVNKYGEIFEE